jgi:hypothetical protein
MLIIRFVSGALDFSNAHMEVPPRVEFSLIYSVPWKYKIPIHHVSYHSNEIYLRPPEHFLVEAVFFWMDYAYRDAHKNCRREGASSPHDLIST